MLENMIPITHAFAVALGSLCLWHPYQSSAVVDGIVCRTQDACAVIGLAAICATAGTRVTHTQLCSEFERV